MTRFAFLPTPYIEDHKPTEREAEIQDIRRVLSLIASRLTQKPERVERSIGEIETELKRLRKVKEING